MEKKHLIVFAVLLVLFGLVGFAEAQSDQQRNSPTYNQSPSYNYQHHAQDNYINSRENFQNNPTQQNRQVMEQREQIRDMRDQQYQQNNWNTQPPTNPNRR